VIPLTALTHSPMPLRLPDAELVEIDPIELSTTNKVREAWDQLKSYGGLSTELEQDLKLARFQGLFGTKCGALPWTIKLQELLFLGLSRNLAPCELRLLGTKVVPEKTVPSKVRIEIRSLERLDSFCYRSPLRPKVIIQGQSLELAYNLKDDDHFTRRLEERTVYDPSGVYGKDQVFGFLYYYDYFDLITLPSSQPAIRLWNWCDPKIPLSEFWSEVLPDSAVDGPDLAGRCFYRSLDSDGTAFYLVGYCPVNEARIEKGQAVLNTLLLPGMGNTPEAYEFTKGMSTAERARFDKQVESLTIRNLTDTKDFSLLRDLNRHVPQVQMIRERVFRYGDR